MQELSLNVLDIAQNSVRAGASLVRITLDEDREKETLMISVADDGCGMTEEQVKIETSRCLGCGATIVDKNRCIGCGICTTKCEFDAIHIKRERPECSKMVKSEDKMKAILPYMIKREFKIKKANRAKKD